MPITWSYGFGGSSSGPVLPGADTSSPTLDQFAELALDPVTWDLLDPIQIIRGAPAIAQKIKTRFRFFLGEWFLDQRLGVPYFRDILIKNPDPILISQIFRTVLITTPGVLRVATFSATLDAPTRTLTVNFQAVLADGSTLLTATAEPFIIPG